MSGDDELQAELFSDAFAAVMEKKDQPVKQPTRAQLTVIRGAVEIMQDAPTDQDRAYMARQLVQATLPHKNPGDVPAWSRTNGNLTLGIQPGVDFETAKSYGYPYGTIPRLLLFWMTTEAVRTKSPRLELGHSLAEFMRQVGLNPGTGGGKRSDARRLQEQALRLFRAKISFIYKEIGPSRVIRDERDMNVTDRRVLWWNRDDPAQAALWGSFVELSDKFYQAITASPVPADYRALRLLKKSPLALDLYAWLTYEAYRAHRSGKPRFVAWPLLMQQFGAEYSGEKAVTNFQQKAAAALRKIQVVYPKLKLGTRQGGIEVLPGSFTAISPLPDIEGKAGR
jgi:hypothetical protein